MMKYLILSLLLGGVVFTRVTAQEPLPAETATKTAPPHGSTDPARAYRDAADSLDQDLRSALDELAALRAVIAAEKPAIATESNRVAADLREKRRQSEIARTAKDATEAAFEKTENDLKIWRDERAYLESLVLDFRKTREASFPPATAPAGAPDAPLALVEEILSELSLGSGPITLAGEAVADDGIATPGRFVKMGPVSWFLGDDGVTAGLVADGNALRARLLSGVMSHRDIAGIVNGTADSITFDPTLGSAIALSDSESSLTDHLRQGGFWIYPILLLAAIALAATLFKWVQLARIRQFGSSPVQLILGALERGEPGSARREAAAIRHPARAILEQGINFIERSPDGSRDDLEECLYEKYLEATPPLHRGLPFIAIAAAAAPLLGLLGTVTGMIETFRLINVFGTGDAKSLASGISEALITTEFGLIVAIPALILHALLSRKVQGIKATMEMTSLAFLNGIKSK
jgi:biopolymer transport protein ExbB